MFWGITIKAGGNTEIKLEQFQELRVSNAAVELDDTSGDKVQAKVYLKVDGKSEYLLCSLAEDNPTHPLALEFNQEDNIYIVVKGTGTVHLTGSLDIGDDLTESDISGSESAMSVSPVSARN